MIIDAALGGVCRAGSSRTTAAVCVVVRSGSSTGSSSADSADRPGAKVHQSVAHRLDNFPRGSCQKVLADEWVELTVQNGLDISCLVTGSGIFDQLVRL